jgi:hypothetical protein
MNWREYKDLAKCHRIDTHSFSFWPASFDFNKRTSFFWDRIKLVVVISSHGEWTYIWPKTTLERKHLSQC